MLSLSTCVVNQLKPDKKFCSLAYPSFQPNQESYLFSLLLTAPGQPINFQVAVRDSTSVQLSWALPTTKNGIIRKFKLSYGKTGSSLAEYEEIQGNTTLSYTLTGLDKCTLYSFKILAYTIKDGPNTTEIQRTTAEDGKY